MPQVPSLESKRLNMFNAVAICVYKYVCTEHRENEDPQKL